MYTRPTSMSPLQQGYVRFLAAASEASSYSQEHSLSPTSDTILPSSARRNITRSVWLNKLKIACHCPGHTSVTVTLSSTHIMYHALTSSQASEPGSKLLQTSRWAPSNPSAGQFGPIDWAVKTVKPQLLWIKQSPDFCAKKIDLLLPVGAFCCLSALCGPGGGQCLCVAYDRALRCRKQSPGSICPPKVLELTESGRLQKSGSIPRTFYGPRGDMAPPPAVCTYPS